MAEAEPEGQRKLEEHPPQEKQGRDLVSLDEAERRSFRMTNEDAAMWRDYKIFKFAGLLHEWKRLYKARLPAHMHKVMKID